MTFTTIETSRLARTAFSPAPNTDVLDQVVELFHLNGHAAYEVLCREPVTALEHALQCAQLAEWAEAPTALVVASLLHDIGHFIAPARGGDAVDDVHELRALGLLAADFGAEVIEPIRLHVQAKRYLVRVDRRYKSTLSEASLHTLRLQGGAMSTDEMQWFEALPHSAQAVTLRRWDDLAKQPGRPTPPLSHYLELADTVRSCNSAP
jgi:predicted HD phosphohydrolase